MQIIPTVDGQNLNKCITAIKVIRGFVSILGIKISRDNRNLKQLIKLFDHQPTELELFIEGEDYNDRLQEIVTAHSDVNIGKVFFYNNNPDTVEQDTTNIRIFGINPGIFIDDRNYNKPAIVNKFEYGNINARRVPNYLTIYKHLKSNEFKGSLLLDFERETIPQEILTNPDFDGVYFDITNNPRIKDTISTYRRAANSIY